MKKKFLIGIALFALACNRHFQSHWVKQQAPEQFTARFETTRGDFDVQITRAHSPAAVDRFYQQVVHRFYDNAVFYRVIPGFVAQFGISDTNRINQWSKFKVQDETVVKGNERGSLSFARAGKETRGTDLYFNLVNNPRLDTITYNEVKGFPCFGKIISGHTVIDSIYSGYASRSVDQLDTLYRDRKKYLSAFPKLDMIKKISVLP
jgi:homoserine O-acetyltransferase